MDQLGHVTRFRLYRHFSLCNPISIINKMGNWTFVESNKIQFEIKKISLKKKEFSMINKYSNSYLIFYRNDVKRIENVGKVGT